MYELWLGLNIFWEMALRMLPGVLLLPALWLVLVVLAMRRQRLAAWCNTFHLAFLAAIAGGVLAFFCLPMLTSSSFEAMGYWLDWAVLAAMTAGVGAVTFLFAWPLLTCMQSCQQCTPSEGA